MLYDVVFMYDVLLIIWLIKYTLLIGIETEDYRD